MLIVSRLRLRLLAITFLIGYVSCWSGVAGVAAREQTRVPLANPALQPTSGGVDDSCRSLENRLDAQVTRFTLTHQRYQQQYHQLTEQLERVVTLMSDRGYDVTELRRYAQELKTTIDTFETDFQAFISQLARTRLYSCSQTEGVFQTELERARNLLTVVEQDAERTHRLYHQVIKAEITSLRLNKTD